MEDHWCQSRSTMRWLSWLRECWYEIVMSEFLEQGVGTDDISFPLAQGYDIHVLGGTVAWTLCQQGTAATDYKPDGCGGSVGEKLPEEME